MQMNKTSKRINQNSDLNGVAFGAIQFIDDWNAQATKPAYTQAREQRYNQCTAALRK